MLLATDLFTKLNFLALLTRGVTLVMPVLPSATAVKILDPF